MYRRRNGVKRGTVHLGSSFRSDRQTCNAARLKISGKEAVNSSLALSTERIDGLNAVTILSPRSSSLNSLHLPSGSIEPFNLFAFHPIIGRVSFTSVIYVAR